MHNVEKTYFGNFYKILSNFGKHVAANLHDEAQRLNKGDTCEIKDDLKEATYHCIIFRNCIERYGPVSVPHVGSTYIAYHFHIFCKSLHVN